MAFRTTPARTARRRRPAGRLALVDPGVDLRDLVVGRRHTLYDWLIESLRPSIESLSNFKKHFRSRVTTCIGRLGRTARVT